MSHIFAQFSVFDTWAKIGSGYFLQHTVNFGHFTECVRFRHMTLGETLQGQHCRVVFNASDSSTLPNDDERENGFDWREV